MWCVMVFYTELIKKPVIDSEGKVVGALVDFVFVDGVDAAKITHIVYLGKDNYKKRLSWEYVEGLKQIENSDTPSFSLMLNTPRVELLPAFIHENDLLAHDLLDKQIIDVTGVKIVRVNDLLLNKVENDFCITGVCVGTTSFFRRLGVRQTGFGKMIYKFSGEKIIPWKSVEQLDTKLTNKGLHLKEEKYKVAEMHPGDIADLMEELSPKEQMLVFNKLDKKTAAKTLVEAQPEIQQSFIRGLKMNRIVELLESMPPHSAADLLAVFGDEKVGMIFKHMNQDKVKKISELLKYPEDTAGALMRTDFFALLDTATAAQALTTLRKTKPSADKTHILFIVDKEDHLAGTLSLRSLLNAQPRQRLKHFMKKHPFAFMLTTSKEDIATAMEKYNYYVMPVVDEQTHLRGIITADEILSAVIPKSWIRRKFIIKPVRKKQKQIEKLTGAVNGKNA